MVKPLKWNDPAEPTAYIRYKGVWDMQDLYESMVDWFRKKKYKFYERVYKHKHPSPFGIERQYVWEAVRRETAYVQFVYNIYFHTYDMHEIEAVAPDGTKKVFWKGRIWMELRARVETDYDKKWETKSFYSHLKTFFNKYIIRKEINQGWVPKLRYEFYELHALIKRRLKMEADEFEHKYFRGVHRVF